MTAMLRVRDLRTTFLSPRGAVTVEDRLERVARGEAVADEDRREACLEERRLERMMRLRRDAADDRIDAEV